MSDRLARAFARFVGSRSDPELERLTSGWRRRPLLAAIFRVMPWRIDRSSLEAGEATLIEIRVRDRRGDRLERRQLLIARGRCTVTRHDLGEPDSVIVFEPVSFLRFVAGQVGARDLFLSGRISVEGSLLGAAELPSLFRRPG